MTEFGPHTRYTDPRIYGLVAGYAWGPHQRGMLLGTHAWEQTQSAASIVACMRERGIQVARDKAGTAWIHMDGLPPDDPMLPTYLEQWQIEIPRVSVLSLHGPVEQVGVVPIFRACVFGRTERSDGVRRDGLNHDAWVVGRSDVRSTHHMDKPGEWWPPGEHVAKRGGVRGTLTRARNTARAVSAALADWEEYSAWIARRRTDMHEDTRGGIAAQLEDEDESVVGVAL